MPQNSAAACRSPSRRRQKTVAVLQERGFVTRDTDPRHARRMLLQVTPLGFEVLRQGEAIFDELREQWERQIGPAQLEILETRLTELVGDLPVRFDTPGWMSQDLGDPI
jgi:DNA-binding MarR family transcriptional regulator